MSVKIYFDLDGTVFDLYGKTNWLELLENENPTAYEGEMLKGLTKEKLNNVATALLNKNVEFGVITWLSKNSSKQFEIASAKVKEKWVKENMEFVTEFNAVSYGTPKQKAIKKRCKKMILLDDNLDVCKQWETKTQREYYNVSDSFNVLDALNLILNRIEKGDI